MSSLGSLAFMNRKRLSRAMIDKRSFAALSHAAESRLPLVPDSTSHVVFSFDSSSMNLIWDMGLIKSWKRPSERAQPESSARRNNIALWYLVKTKSRVLQDLETPFTVIFRSSIAGRDA